MVLTALYLKEVGLPAQEDLGIASMWLRIGCNVHVPRIMSIPIDTIKSLTRSFENGKGRYYGCQHIRLHRIFGTGLKIGAMELARMGWADWCEIV